MQRQVYRRGQTWTIEGWVYPIPILKLWRIENVRHLLRFEPGIIARGHSLYCLSYLCPVYSKGQRNVTGVFVHSTRQCYRNPVGNCEHFILWKYPDF